MKSGTPRRTQLVVKQDPFAPGRGELENALRSEDIARFFGLDVSAIRRRMSAGEFGTPFRLGRRMYVLRAEFDANIDARLNPTRRGASDERR